MDKRQEKGRWDWLPHHMPGVARQVAEKRKAHGAAYVALCWKRGVEEQQPGWFFAREGPLAIGTPFPGDDLAQFQAAPLQHGQSLVVMRPADEVAPATEGETHGPH